MGGSGDGARWHDCNAGGHREQDGLAAEGSLFRNNITMMTDKLKSVAAEHNNVVGDLVGGK